MAGRSLWISSSNPSVQALLNQSRRRPLPRTPDQQPLSLAAYTVFAVAAGLAFAAVIGRTLPAMILTLGTYVGVRRFVHLVLRPRYLPPLTLTKALGVAVKTPFATGIWETGLGPNGLVYYQPASRFGPFQGIDAAIFFALGAVLVAIAAWWLTRRAV